MRVVFVEVVKEELDRNPNLAVVTADISASAFDKARAQYPDRVVNVGIREQTMIGVAGGLALAGLRPVVHSYAPFLVERPFEQIKLDLGHQEVGAVLVSIGGSYDDPVWGRTHQAPGDVALIDSLPGWTVHVPGHWAEVEPLLRKALADDNRVYMRLSTRSNAESVSTSAGFAAVRQGKDGVVIAVGPVLDQVLAAVSTLDVTVLYASTIRPFDHFGLLTAARAASPNIVLVEPYLRGTSAHEVSNALVSMPHRLLSLGVERDTEPHAYGTPEDHDRIHGLHAEGIAQAVGTFLA
nr:transketolase C-terminal domain-containing protein [Kibdelosporangium banguiense]